MVENTGRKPKSADYKGTEVVSVSGNDLYNLRELNIKKEYLLKVVLPFAHSINSGELEASDKSDPLDVLVEDSAGFGYIRRLAAEVLPNGTVGLYEIKPKRKVPVSQYSVSFDDEGRIYKATEDRDIDGKHISVVYEVNETYNDHMISFEAHPSSVVVSFNRGDKRITKLYMNSGIASEDILEEKKFPNNFVQVITLRSDEEANAEPVN
ncbi:hypothetical protein M1567_01315 [Candidatus Marsarchaeota archaeon]|nr:hypothetical protein [Candidatus Marsarchaeota archaeon]